LAYTRNILLTWKVCNWGDIVPVALPCLRPYCGCRLQTGAGTRDWAKFMCTPIW